MSTQIETYFVQRPSPTHIGHMAAEIARPTAAIRSITATALPRKHSFDASQQPFALNPWAERA
jgi:pyridoxine/pyridoxamine 5'-phosphate oxidase